jgi:hypothetical protein
MVFKIMTVLGKRGLYEEIPLLLLLRGLLWLVMIALPCLIIAGFMEGTVSLAMAEIGAGICAALMITAYRWRRVILFCVPAEPLIVASETLALFAPRGLQFSEILKMAVEDNVGDPQPAAKTFAYVPETFEEGLAKVYGI